MLCIVRGTNLLVYFLHPFISGSHVALYDITHVEASITNDAAAINRMANVAEDTL